MPFSSKNQAKWAFATGQPWAAEWAAKTDFTTLPTSANDRYIRGGLIKKYLTAGPVEPETSRDNRQWQLKADRARKRMRYLGDDTYEPEYSFPPFTVEADRKPWKPFLGDFITRSPMTFNVNEYQGGMGGLMTDALLSPIQQGFTYPAHLTGSLYGKYRGKDVDFRPNIFQPMQKTKDGRMILPDHKTGSSYMDEDSHWLSRFLMDAVSDPWSYAGVGLALRGGKTGMQMLRNAAKELPVISEASGIYNLGKLGVQKATQAGHWLGEHLNPFSQFKYNKRYHEALDEMVKHRDEADRLQENKWVGRRTIENLEGKQAKELNDQIREQEKALYDRMFEAQFKNNTPQYQVGTSFTDEGKWRGSDWDLNTSRYEDAIKSGKYSLDTEGNILKTDIQNRGTIYEDLGTVRVRGEEIIDFNTGKKVPVNIKGPGEGSQTKISLTVDDEGKKVLKKEHIDTGEEILENYKANKELFKAYDDNIAFIQNQLPGFKPMGSSQYHKFGVTHLTNDIDGIMKAEDWFPMAENFPSTGQAKYGPKIQISNSNLPGNPVVGEVDVNLIYTDAKTGKASGGLATELYRQFFPDEFYASNIEQIKGKFKTGNKESYEIIEDWTSPAPGGVKFKINKTADELLEAYDPEIKSILDAMEISGYSNAAKRKHINRGDYIMEFGDPDKVLKAQQLYAKSIMGSSADLGKQFDPKMFEDYERNLKLLEKMRDTIPQGQRRPLPGPPLLKKPKGQQQKLPRKKEGPYIPENIAKDPKRMQIALNDFYLNNSIYTRRVNQGGLSNYDELLASFSEWENIGGRNSGLGLNAVQLGDPGAYGNIIGNRQFKLYDDSIETPEEYINTIRGKTSGGRLVEESEKQAIIELANKHGFNPKKGELESLRTFDDFINLSMNKNSVKNTREFLAAVGKEMGMKAVRRPQIRHGNTGYATLLGNFDKELDNLVLSMEKHTPSLKSYMERKSNLVWGPNRGSLYRNENLVKDQNTFYKLKNYIEGGLETAQERLDSSNEMFKALTNQKNELEARIRARKFKKLKETHKNTPLIEKLKTKNKELDDLIDKAKKEKENYKNISQDLLKRKKKLLKTQNNLLLGAGTVGGGVLGKELYDSVQRNQAAKEKHWKSMLKKYKRMDEEGTLTEDEKKHYNVLQNAFSSQYPDSEYRYGGNVKYEEGDEVKKYDPRKFRAGIVEPETQGKIDYSLRPRGAENKVLGNLTGMYGSTAVGPYQFVYGNKPGVGARKSLKEMGWEGKFKDFVGNKEWQEKLMDYYLESGKPGRYPWMTEQLISQYGPKGTHLTAEEGRSVQEGKDWTETGVIPEDWDFKDIMALEHFAGHGNLRELFADIRAGKISPTQAMKYVPGGKNKTVGTYLKEFRQGYEDSPRQMSEEEIRELITKTSSYPQPESIIEPMHSTRVETPIIPEEIKTPIMSEQIVEEEVEDYPDGAFVRRALRRYPYLKSIYGKRGKNLRVKRDRKFRPSDHGNFGHIEYFSPTQDKVRYSEDYEYSHPSVGKYGIVYNPKNTRKGDIFLDMLHGLRDDKEIQPLLTEFSNAIRFQQGPAMDHWYDVDVEGGYKDSREQWNKNYIDGILRSEMSESMEWPTSDDEGYAKTREGNTSEIKSIAARIKETLQNPKQERSEPIPTMEQGGEAIMQETEIVEEQVEEPVREEAPPVKKKTPLTKLTPAEAKRFNLWRIGWGLDDNQLKKEEDLYDIPGYYISDEWKNPGNSYTDVQWQR